MLRSIINREVGRGLLIAVTIFVATADANAVVTGMSNRDSLMCLLSIYGDIQELGGAKEEALEIYITKMTDKSQHSGAQVFSEIAGSLSKIAEPASERDKGSCTVAQKATFLARKEQWENAMKVQDSPHICYGVTDREGGGNFNRHVSSIESYTLYRLAKHIYESVHKEGIDEAAIKTKFLSIDHERALKQLKARQPLSYDFYDMGEVYFGVHCGRGKRSLFEEACTEQNSLNNFMDEPWQKENCAHGTPWKTKPITFNKPFCPDKRIGANDELQTLVTALLYFQGEGYKETKDHLPRPEPDGTRPEPHGINMEEYDTLLREMLDAAKSKIDTFSRSCKG